MQQTLGGAWADSFGEGLSQITIAGHTGWRGGQVADGLALFSSLRAAVFKGWHEQRALNAKNLMDPNLVELIFTDSLNGYSVVVSPGSFNLKRNKSRPLLAQYQINMMVLDNLGAAPIEVADAITESINNPRGRYNAATQSLNANIARYSILQGLVGDVLGTSGTEGRLFLDKSSELLVALQDVAARNQGIFDRDTVPLLSAARLVNQAGRNAFQLVGQDRTVGIDLLAAQQQIAANFNDAYCNLTNGFGVQQIYPDYSALFGSSTCSSTGGGSPPSPLANMNAFEQIFASRNAIVAIDRDALDALLTLGQDPLIRPYARLPIGNLFGTIASGVTLQ